MRNIFLFLITCIFIHNGYAQNSDLKIEVEYNNFTEKINDLEIVLHLEGGVAPYQFKWSEPSVLLTSNIARGLTEGKKYNVIITDANGIKEKVEVYYSPESNDESINAFFIPIVDEIGTILMADVFALLNLYDPVIHDDNGNPILLPNGDKKKMSIPLVVVWLVLGALYFTIKMNFINVRGFKHAIQLISGKFDNPKAKGEVTHFQALTAALSATVGLGNIAGVAIAIAIGGPGATLWMIVAGLLGMSSKFVECTLGVKYRKIDKNGIVSGGPMYYLNQGFANRKMKYLGKILAFIFAVLIIGASFGGGNMFQANQAFAQFALITDLHSQGATFGIILAILVGIVIIGGIKSIARVTSRVVPIMAVLYVATAIFIIIMNISNIGEAFALIFNEAFSPAAVRGGIVGVLIVGFQRAAFSNEAGVGSAAIAHSAVKTKEPITEGIVALLGPFVDTVVICTMTALVIIFTGFYTNIEGLAGVEITSQAFQSVIPWFPYILVVAIFLFAFSTMISWSYYGLNGFLYLFGRFSKRRKLLRNIYFTLFLVCIVVGSSSSLGAVVDFADMMILSMAFPNVVGLIVFSSEVKKDLRSYLRRVKSGEIKKYK